jgi:hypothetical protein
MSLVTCAGADVLHGRVHLPGRRAWFASLVLDTATPPSGSVTIAADGGFSLKGTIVPDSGVFLEASHVSVVGGAGGLSKIISPAAYERAQLRDPLNAIMNDSGESLSSTVAASITGLQLDKWTLVASTAAQALDELCGIASTLGGQPVTWRVLDDGTVWLGVESWPASKLSSNDDVLEFFPSEGRYVIGAATPSILPGVNLDGVGKVGAVDHYLRPDMVRSWAWV